MVAGPQIIAGLAWAPGRGITAVEVGLTDVFLRDETEWFEAELAEVESNETWVQWRYEWDAREGDWFIQVRATDGDGITQSEEMVPAAPDGAEGHHTLASRIS